MVYEETLKVLKDEHRLRGIPQEMCGLDLISNDYMGLGARCGEFMDEFRLKYSDAPMSASASRLLQRNHRFHNELESKLDALYNKKSLIFNSGYHANVGALSALSLPGTLIVSDKLAHASMIDGIRLGRGDTARFAHNDMRMLRKILDKKAAGYRQIVIVTESVFSMDGDLAPLSELIDIKKDFPGTLLYMDEAHGFGVMGEKGLGLAEELGVIDDIDILVGTLGKAAAGFGAFIATSPTLCNYILNSARSFIFSTALPPSIVAWDTFMIDKLLTMNAERKYLKALSEWFRRKLIKKTGHENVSRSQIVPLHAGSAERSIEIAAGLRKAGVDALPIRRPTVPAGGERIRLSLSANLTRDDLQRVLDVL